MRSDQGTNKCGQMAILIASFAQSTGAGAREVQVTNSIS
jgi:hypothetical protein